jgi:hypothetical protein
MGKVKYCQDCVYCSKVHQHDGFEFRCKLGVRDFVGFYLDNGNIHLYDACILAEESFWIKNDRARRMVISHIKKMIEKIQKKPIAFLLDTFEIKNCPEWKLHIIEKLLSMKDIDKCTHSPQSCDFCGYFKESHSCDIEFICKIGMRDNYYTPYPCILNCNQEDLLANKRSERLVIQYMRKVVKLIRENPIDFILYILHINNFPKWKRFLLEVLLGIR